MGRVTTRLMTNGLTEKFFHINKCRDSPTQSPQNVNDNRQHNVNCSVVQRRRVEGGKTQWKRKLSSSFTEVEGKQCDTPFFSMFRKRKVYFLVSNRSSICNKFSTKMLKRQQIRFTTNTTISNKKLSRKAVKDVSFFITILFRLQISSERHCKTPFYLVNFVDFIFHCIYFKRLEKGMS